MKPVLVNGQVADFEVWWAAYPRKRKKGHARIAYAKALQKTDAATLLASLDRRWGRPDMILYPTTFLNAESWTDEIDNVDPVLRVVGLDADGHMLPETGNELSALPRNK